MNFRQAMIFDIRLFPRKGFFIFNGSERNINEE